MITKPDLPAFPGWCNKSDQERVTCVQALLKETPWYKYFTRKELKMYLRVYKKYVFQHQVNTLGAALKEDKATMFYEPHPLATLYKNHNAALFEYTLDRREHELDLSERTWLGTIGNQQNHDLYKKVAQLYGDGEQPFYTDKGENRRIYDSSY